ncbi:Glycosyltransferase family 1 protein [Brevibacillus sp. IT-7CA2]|uniref:glycosyltransferase n=1 Tax=Brevibacillus sp. IT-7CA2 TaxID=3026436 RepID=UPI0039E0085D
MTDKLKILILIRPFGIMYPKHRIKFDMIEAIGEYAEVKYWFEDGDIRDILKKTKFQPDFIFHYDSAWRYKMAPRITGLDKIDIPKGCFVSDLHYHPSEENKKKHHEQSRIDYITKNHIDLVFSVSKHPFLQVYPQFKDKHRWLPWSMNPNVIKDWECKKEIKFLLMGQLYVNDSQNPPKRIPPKGDYKFREAVLANMNGVEGFVFHPHPGHLVSASENAYVNEKYAKEINRSNIFFTCGGQFDFAVLKFFEAPGCRTLLLAEPNKDMLDLGFEDGVNFVACTEDNLYEKAMYYDQNMEERKRITENGYAFIHKYHINSVRAQQFLTYVKNFINNRPLSEDPIFGTI